MLKYSDGYKKRRGCTGRRLVTSSELRKIKSSPLFSRIESSRLERAKN